MRMFPALGKLPTHTDNERKRETFCSISELMRLICLERMFPLGEGASYKPLSNAQNYALSVENLIFIGFALILHLILLVLKDLSALVLLVTISELVSN